MVHRHGSDDPKYKHVPEPDLVLTFCDEPVRALDDWEMIDDPTEAAIKRNQHRRAFGYSKYD
jgi:hypothetical protein